MAQNPDEIFTDESNESVDETKNFFLDTIAKFCDRCGTAYSQNDINIVKKTQGQLLMHIKCPQCHSSNLVSFLRQAGLSSRTPFHTDLTIDELKHFSSQDAISSNEVLDVYDYVNAQKNLSADIFLKLLNKAEVAGSSERSSH